MEDVAIIIAIIFARVRWSLFHCFCLLHYFFFFFFAFLWHFCSPRTSVWTWLWFVAAWMPALALHHLSGSACVVIRLSLSALNSKFLNQRSWLAQFWSDARPLVQSGALGRSRLSLHMEVYASWHVQPSFFRGSIRAAEERWTVLYLLPHRGAPRFQGLGQAFRTPAAGTWSLLAHKLLIQLELEIIAEFPLWLSLLRIRLVSIRMWVPSLALLSALRFCSTGHRCGSDPCCCGCGVGH